MWVDRHTVILSTSSRANRSGYEQMETELRRQGVTEIIPMQIPYGHAHIDGLLNFPSNDVAVIHACQVPYEVVELQKAGITVDVLDLSELNKGRGSVHCMTAFLKRDEQ